MSATHSFNRERSNANSTSCRQGNSKVLGHASSRTRVYVCYVLAGRRLLVTAKIKPANASSTGTPNVRRSRHTHIFIAACIAEQHSYFSQHMLWHLKHQSHAVGGAQPTPYQGSRHECFGGECAAIPTLRACDMVCERHTL
jgi:hypothetical protein